MGRFLLVGACGRRDPRGMRQGGSGAVQAGTQGCCWWEQPGAPRCRGHASEHSVPCSTSPVFCSRDTQPCLAGVCLCEVLCLTEIQQLLPIFILFNQLLIMFSVAYPLQAGLCHAVVAVPVQHRAWAGLPLGQGTPWLQEGFTSTTAALHGWDSTLVMSFFNYFEDSILKLGPVTAAHLSSCWKQKVGLVGRWSWDALRRFSRPGRRAWAGRSVVSGDQMRSGGQLELLTWGETSTAEGGSTSS